MKKAIFNFINLILNIVYGRNITIKTNSGVFFLKTTFGHPLKRYLIKFPTYDRLLPFLSKVISKSVVDIGANIGDTMVLTKSIHDVEVICVEPDSHFINYLRMNVALNKFDRVKIYPYPISSINKNVVVEKNLLKSSSNIGEADIDNLQKGIQTKTFHDLLNDLDIDIRSIGIIKSDTDGYDWDCLNSVADYFESGKNRGYYPDFILFEHQTYLNNLGPHDAGREEREKHYLDSIRRLMKYGYTDFFIFDNFGKMVKHINELEEFVTLTEQIKTAQLKGDFSVFFLDVVMAQNGKGYLVQTALDMQASEKMIID